MIFNDTIMEWDEVCENTLIKAERSNKCTDTLCIYRHLAFTTYSIQGLQLK